MLVDCHSSASCLRGYTRAAVSGLGSTRWTIPSPPREILQINIRHLTVAFCDETQVEMPRSRLMWVQEDGSTSIDNTTLRAIRSQVMNTLRRQERHGQVLGIFQTMSGKF